MLLGKKAKKRPKKLFGRVTACFALNVALLFGIIGYELSSLPKPCRWDLLFPIATSLLTGGLVSFFFYWLVVYIPEQRKRKVIKNNLSKIYKKIKINILSQVVSASIKGGRRDLDTGIDTVEKLMSPKAFKDAFSGGREADEGFYAFENQMSDNTPEFGEIILNLEMLAKQIDFVLHNYSIDDQDLFDFFKRLELMLLTLRRSSAGYEESKPLCRFIFEMFSGFNIVEGHRGYDVIDKMIADI